MSARRQPSIPPKIPGYEFVRLLGMGGFADVFEYRQELPRRSVAVKVLLSGSLDQEAREAFFAEANVMAQLSHHPSIVTVYHADIASDGRPYLVMEYCSRPGLGTRYRMERFTVAEVLRTGIRVASAVEAAHHLGILHRDIKPANILATDFGWPALTDFGIASTLGSSAAATGMSIPWAAPELLAERPTGDARGDVYSLGATIYSLLVGRSPFEVPGRSNSPADLLSRIERAPLPTIDREDVPPSLSAVLARAMAKDPDRRFLSALALAHSLQQVERSMHLPVTSIDLSQDILPEVPAAQASGADFSGESARDDQVTRLRPVVSIDPEGTPASGAGAGAGAAAPAGAPTTRAQARAARRTQPPPPAPPAGPTGGEVQDVDEDATRLRPITTIAAQPAPTGTEQVAQPWGTTDGSSRSTGQASPPEGAPGHAPRPSAQPPAPPPSVPGETYPHQGLPRLGAPQPYPTGVYGEVPQDHPAQAYPAQGYAVQPHPAQPYRAEPNRAEPYRAQPQVHQQGAALPEAPFAPSSTAFAPTPAEIRSQHYRKPSTDDEPDGRDPRRWWAVGAASAVVVAALVTVGVLTLGRDADSNPQATDQPLPTPTAVEEATVPAPAKLTGVDQGDGTASFTWENPDAKDGDTYVWREVAVGVQGEAHRTDSTEVVVPFDDGAEIVCIEVSIVRDDGRSSTLPVQECSR